MARPRPAGDLHAKAAAIADALEAELRRLGRWAERRPPPEAFENMGAFGGRTMAFEPWIRFVLLERIREIVSTRGAFPASSQVGAYAVRELEHHGESPPERASEPDPIPGDPNRKTITLGDTALPGVIYTLIEVLPQFEGGRRCHEGPREPRPLRAGGPRHRRRRPCRRRLTRSFSARGWAPAAGSTRSAAGGR